MNIISIKASSLLQPLKKLLCQGNINAVFSHFDDRLNPANQNGGLFWGKNTADVPRGLPGISNGMVPEPKAQLNRFSAWPESVVRTEVINN